MNSLIFQQWTDEILKMANNLLALNGSVSYFLRKAYVRLTLQADKGGKIAIKRYELCSKLIFYNYLVIEKDLTVPLNLFSIVRTFAQHKDDRRRVEKAFIESTGLPSGKVKPLIELSI